MTLPRLPTVGRGEYRSALWPLARSRALPVVAVLLLEYSAFALLGDVLGDYLLGLLQGVVLIVDLAMLLACCQVSSYSPASAGRWSGDHTVSVLATARRRRLIWGWVSDLEADGASIDHLVVTHEGGLVMIQLFRPSDRPTAEVIATEALAAQRAAGRAVTVLRLLRLPTELSTLMVLWGGIPSHPRLAVTRRIDSLDVVSGPDLLAWLGGLVGTPSDKKTAQEILSDLERHQAAPGASRPPRPAVAPVLASA